MVSVCLENGKVLVRKQARPRRPEGFALIRLLYGGICNTDIELQRGYYGFRGTPGHEFVGEVVDADDRSGSASAWWAKSIWPAENARGARADWDAIVPPARCSAS
jgi:NADPH:quinone reductase-like Zn-dependent oxidoreductase